MKLIFYTSLLLFSLSAFSQNARIVVNASRIMNKIPAQMFGSCIEDVNHEIYGGLYDQLLYGESFEEPSKTGRARVAVSSAWDVIENSAEGSFGLDSTGAYNGKQAQIIQYDKGSGKLGVANSGLNHWGIAIKKGELFQGRIYLHGDSFNGPVTLALQSADGSKTYATQSLINITPVWKKYTFTLKASSTDTQARFAVYIEKKGKLWIDQAVLMPTGVRQFKNLPIRADIANHMKQEGLNFLRYGGSMVNAAEYRWKNMTGDPDKRPPYKGSWYPYSSNSFGIEEFLKFCEAAGFEAAFAINIEETPEDLAGMVEYLTGDIASSRGKERADNGHPKPYKLHYIEIGNEEVIGSDDSAGYSHYVKRFTLLYDAIHSEDPKINVICSAWWRHKSPNMESVFKAINGKATFWDLHVDADAARSGTTVDQTLTSMQQLFLAWDPHTRMKCTVFEENGGRHDLQRALGHATVLNAIRRHGDFLLTSCAANALQPFHQNDNGWDQGQIFFTPAQVWGMPPFYAQQMAAKNDEPLRVFSTVKGDLDVTAARSEQADVLVIHVINPTAGAINSSIALQGFQGAKQMAKAYSLSGNPAAENTPENPKNIITTEKNIAVNGDMIEYRFPANSYTILRFEK